MPRSVSSNCTAHVKKPPALGSASPHTFPPYPFRPTKRVLLIRSPVPGSPRLGRSFSQPGGSPGSLRGAAGLPIEAGLMLIPSLCYLCVSPDPYAPSNSSPKHFTSDTIPFVSPNFAPQWSSLLLEGRNPWCLLPGAIGSPAPSES